MTPEILLVLGILVVVIGVLVSDAIPLEVLALLVLGINRARLTSLAPEVHENIRSEDELIVEGRLDRIQEMNNWDFGTVMG